MIHRVLVLGGSGFVGAAVCARLAAAGVRVTVPTRRIARARSVQTLPGVEVVECDINHADGLARVLVGHQAVVNLAAILHGQAQEFERAHVELPATVGRACAAAGLRRVVHVSALGASLTGASMYQRTKAGGEVAIRAFGLDVTVLRPSLIFGAGDASLNLFARMQQLAPVVPLAGAATRFQPVWVGDVGTAIARCVLQAGHAAKTYEICGPETFSLRELVQLAGRLSGHERPIFELPDSTAHALAWVLEHLPIKPMMTRDNLASLSVDNVATGELPGLADLGITPTRLGSIAPTYLGRTLDLGLDTYRAGAGR